MEGVSFALVRWLFFAVALSLLPLLISVLGSVSRGATFDWVGLLDHGELLLVSAAVVGAALADLVTDGGAGYKTAKLSTGGTAVLVLIAASTWFADIAAAHRDGSDLDPHGIAVGSLVIFGFAILAGVSCIVVAGLGRKG